MLEVDLEDMQTRVAVDYFSHRSWRIGELPKADDQYIGNRDQSCAPTEWQPSGAGLYGCASAIQQIYQEQLEGK
jgi:hypothetical protein